MKIDILGSSSQGNCIIYDNTTMVDVGLPFKDVENYLKNIKRIFISHEHGDHINVKTILAIHAKNPRIKFYSNADVIKKFDLSFFEIYTSDSVLNFNEFGFYYTINFINLYHNNLDSSLCTNHGYLFTRIDEFSGVKYIHLHATDTNTMEGINVPKCDSIGLECNYNMEVVGEQEMPQYILRGISGHLEDLNFWEFVERFLKENGTVYPLHMSGRNLIKDNLLIYAKLKNINLMKWW